MSSQKGRGGMGSHKHGVSGRAGKSPRLRHSLKREAEKQTEQARKTTTKWSESVEDLFSDEESEE